MCWRPPVETGRVRHLQSKRCENESRDGVGVPPKNVHFERPYPFAGPLTRPDMTPKPSMMAS